MNSKDSRILVRRKRNLSQRLGPRAWDEQPKPMLAARDIQYEMADRTRAIPCGGVGAFHVLAERVGSAKALDRRLHLLKVHLPYHESGHGLNLAYNSLTGGTALDDFTLRRNDETYLNALGAERIPAPRTAGDFARRLGESDVVGLLDAVNGRPDGSDLCPGFHPCQAQEGIVSPGLLPDGMPRNRRDRQIPTLTTTAPAPTLLWVERNVAFSERGAAEC